MQVLSLAQAMNLVRLGQIALDGSKVQANASRHKALSTGHIEKIKARLREEVQAVLTKAEATDRGALPDGLDLPTEVARREDRLQALAAAKAKIEERARARFEDEQRAYEEKAAHREAQRRAGRKPRGQEPRPLGRNESALMDNGYFSAANVGACAGQGIEPLIALGREAHHLSLDERFGPDAPMKKMAWRLRTKDGRDSYAKRKSTVEPVFGIIKHVMRFRQFSLRGLAAVTGEWTLVTLAFNLKRMNVLRFA